MKVLINRLIAWFLDFLISIVFFNYLLSFDVFVGIREEIIQKFIDLSFSETNSNIFSNICLIYLLTTSLRFYSCLILGRSLSQMVVGIKARDGLLWSRIGGGLRCFLELLIPMSLVDVAFLLRGQKTLKETISGTVLIDKSNLFFRLATVAYTLFILFFAIGSPLLQNMTFVDGVNIAFSKVKLEKIDNRTDFSKFKHYPSESFKMSSFSSIKDSHLIFIPSFEITREKNKKRIRPYLVIHDVERQVQGDLKLQRRFSLLKVIQIASKYDPLFDFYYPELSKVMKRPVDYYSIKKYDSSFGDNKLLNPIARKEIQELIQASFELSFKNLGHSIAKNGPFISGHIKVRNLLLSLVDSTVAPTVDLVKLGNYNFLRFKQSFEDINDGKRNYRESYIPIETLNSSVITMEWGTGMKEALARKDFKSKFLGASKWFFDYSSVFKISLDEDKFSAFTVLDHFSDNSLDAATREALEKYTFTYFYDLSASSMKEEDETLRNSLIASINRLILLNNYARVKSKDKSKEVFSVKFSRLMSNLKNALKTKNKNFFEVK
ncbi:hypothetical protein [Halobacteriovorax sp. JY17]|uniref:hypothetical protein n=1 Tax=Halobacteriovorax sp. JY17 TaxID=2014617 RepID=UPI000C369D30|nr:hypothetical protein [Halobacteriovorax sp. JY17]PIK15912.1 MAG: hypothetical protein CES88_04075 [Halobacteriovorax sp. JY17]